MLREEFKDSNDYLMQKWFLEQKKQITSWFESNIMSGFNFDQFEWSSNDAYSVYSANLKFNNEKNEYAVDFLIDSEKVEDGQVEEWEISIRSYDAMTAELIGELKKTVKNSDWSAELLIQLINDVDNKSTEDEQE